MALPIEEYVLAVTTGLMANETIIRGISAARKETGETVDEFFARRVWEIAAELKSRETP